MMENKTTKVFKDVSVARAIAIVMMVLGHAFVGTDIEHFAHVFHMPLFFFTAGYCFKEAYLDETCQFLKKRIMGLWWPYVKWGFVFLICHNLFFFIGIHNTEWGGFLGHPEERYAMPVIIENFWRLIHFQYQEQLLGGYWFLQDLFWGSLIFFVCKKYIKQDWILLVGLLLAAIIFAKKKIFDPFFDISSDDVFAAWYVATGYFFHKKLEHSFAQFCKSKPLLSYCCVFVGVIGMLLCVKYGLYGFKYCLWNQIPMKAMASVGSIATIWLLCMIFVRRFSGTNICKCMQYVGNHTLEILTWHFLCFKVVSLLIIIIFGLDMACLAEFPTITEYANMGWGWVYAIIALTIVLCGCKMRERYCRGIKATNIVSP